jgi:hypothetical protein
MIIIIDIDQAHSKYAKRGTDPDSSHESHQ